MGADGPRASRPAHVWLSGSARAAPHQQAFCQLTDDVLETVATSAFARHWISSPPWTHRSDAQCSTDQLLENATNLADLMELRQGSRPFGCAGKCSTAAAFAITELVHVASAPVLVAAPARVAVNVIDCSSTSSRQWVADNATCYVRHGVTVASDGTRPLAPSHSMCAWRNSKFL